MKDRRDRPGRTGVEAREFGLFSAVNKEWLKGVKRGGVDGRGGDG